MTTSSTPTPTLTTPNLTLETLHFDNRSVRDLPVGEEAMPGTIFSWVKPTPLRHPQIVAVSPSALAWIDLPMSEARQPHFAQVMSGNLLPVGSTPAAHCYAGHQFGLFAGQLGDGAAMYIGEVINSNNERVELQYKGAGLTPYSRAADGRKVLRSSLREFLASEHMHALGVPTTRACSLVTSDSTVVRDIFYTGNPLPERCSVIVRMAPTFLRFGSFEIFKPRDEETGAVGPAVGRWDTLRQLIDYTIRHFYPDVQRAFEADVAKSQEAAAATEAAATATASTSLPLHTRIRRDVHFFTAVTKRTARLVAKWMSVGWIHGVLNTDNMSIAGLTIDYGPFQFLDAYIPSATSNTSDEHSRYAYQQQPGICAWNLRKLAEALSLAYDADQRATVLAQMRSVVETEYWNAFEMHFYELMSAKLGISSSPLDLADEKQYVADRQLIDALLETLEGSGADFTFTFRSMADVPMAHVTERKSGANENDVDADASEIDDDDGENDDDVAARPTLDAILARCCSLDVLRKAYEARIPDAQLEHIVQLLASDPRLKDSSGIVAQEVARKKKREALVGAIDEDKRAKDRRQWRAWLRRYQARIRVEYERERQAKAKAGAGTASLDDERAWSEARRTRMNATNPKYVLRNWMAQYAIERAEKGDFSEVQRLLYVLTHPFDELTAAQVEAVADQQLPIAEYEDQKEKQQEKQSDAAASSSTSTSSTSRPFVYDLAPPKWASNLKCSCSS